MDRTAWIGKEIARRRSGPLEPTNELHATAKTAGIETAKYPIIVRALLTR